MEIDVLRMLYLMYRLTWEEKVEDDRNKLC